MKRRGKGNSSIDSLSSDLLSLIFSNVDCFVIAICSSVCKSWHDIIQTSNLLQVQYHKYLSKFLASYPSSSGIPLRLGLERFALDQHRVSLQNKSVHIQQWSSRSLRTDQCRMKMGTLLTGVGDKVVRIWSLEGYKCLEEYSVPGKNILADFDFDESKIVGLFGTRLCIWRRHGNISIFPSREDTFMRGLCMRYIDPEAMVGCGDGTVRVFDMYSRTCSRILKMHAGPVTCLTLTEDQRVISGSSLGNITVAGHSSDQPIASLKSAGSTGITSLCFNSPSYTIFAGSTAGYVHCWDLRTMRPLWETRVSPNVIYSLQHLRNDTSSLVVGGIDGVLRVLNQETGYVISSYMMNDDTLRRLPSSGSRSNIVEIKKVKKLSPWNHIDTIPKNRRPPITSLAVGMKKVITTHSSHFISMWKFNI